MNDLPEKMMNYFCNACQEVFAVPVRRGRPPKYCAQCIDDNRVTEEFQREARLRKAKVRIDNLELMLRSNGTHLSQNRHRWE